MAWLNVISPGARKGLQTNRRASKRPGLRLTALDERIVPTVSSIVSNFNGTSISAGSTIWFNSVLKVSNLPNTDVTIYVKSASVDSGYFHQAVADAQITFSTSATTASTTFDSGSNTWVTIVPRSISNGNTF